MNDTNWWWSYLLVAVGLFGFIIVGMKTWWGWYINLFCQILWFIYAGITQQYGFVIGAVVYTMVFGYNAFKWTRSRFMPEWIGESVHVKLSSIKARTVEEAAEQFEKVAGHPPDTVYAVEK